MPKIVLSERFKRPPWFLSYESYLRPEDNPISSHPEARDNRIVPLVIADYGNTLARLKQIRYIGRQLAGAIKEMRISAKSVRANPYTGNTTIDADTLHELETYAYSLGITDIGYTQINTRYIFKRFKILYPNAIVFTMAMDKEKIKQALQFLRLSRYFAPITNWAWSSTRSLIFCVNGVSTPRHSLPSAAIST